MQHKDFPDIQGVLVSDKYMMWIWLSYRSIHGLTFSVLRVLWLE